MEQQQLKKGLAKQFIFRSDQIVNQTLDYFFTEFKNYNFSNRSWKKVNSYFESTKKFALHKTEFGTRKNPCFGITFLVASKYNDEKEWDEENRLQVPREFIQHFRCDGRSDCNSKKGTHKNTEHSHIFHRLSTERCDQAPRHRAK